jgi:hypothetical protein
MNDLKNVYKENMSGGSGSISGSGGGFLSPEEYERRKVFLEGLKTLTKAEYIEIVRILQKHEVVFSENANGIFFNVGMLEQSIFDSLTQFLHFTQSNRRDLAAREKEMITLKTELIPDLSKN